jgi:hypothetical protein
MTSKFFMGSQKEMLLQHGNKIILRKYVHYVQATVVFVFSLGNGTNESLATNNMKQ